MNLLNQAPPEQRQKYFVGIVPHSHALGFRYVDHTPGRVVFDLPYREDLVGDPVAGTIHGGVITTMVDAVCGQAVLTALREVRRIATLDLRIDYLRPARAGATVRCVAECYRVTRQVAFTRAVAHDGDEADPLATSAGTFMVFDDTQSSHAAAGLLDPKP
ncbi:PaaI family thioesterase [Panacagrimonas sp.]|uniref:PaaI family thioesterase n=1 Tax=Panacagrimonas sp. TaxID=2480088 RepID=UPI003B530521